MADAPAIRITAIDQASSVFANISRSLGGIESAATVVNRAMGALAGAFSVGAVTAWAEGVVRAAGDLNQLANVTGSSVESLSRLSNIAKVSGTDFGTFKTMLERMTASMAGVEDGSNKGARALEYLGVSARDPATALQEVADKLSQYADGASKAAIARDLFGRGGQEFLNVLKQMADAQAVGATVTKQQAEEAERLEEQIRRLGIEATTFKNILLSDVVPALNTWIVGIKAARAEGLGWFDSFIVGTTFADRIVPSISQVTAEIAKLQKKIDDGKRYGFGDWVQEWSKDLDEAQKKLKTLVQMRDAAIMQNVARMGYTGDVRDYQATKKPELGYTGGGDTGRTKELRDTFSALRDELLRTQAAVDGLSEAEKVELAIEKNVADATAKQWTPAEKELARWLAASTDYIKERDAALKATFDDQVKYNKEQAESESAVLKQTMSAEKLVANLEMEAAALTMSNEEREKAIALLELERTGVDKTSDAYQGYVDRINAAVANKAQLQGQIDVWKSIENAAHDTFMHIWEQGKSVWERLTESLKSTLLELLYQMTIKKWVISISANATGIPGAAMASNLGGSGVGSLFSGLFGSGATGATGSFIANTLPASLGGGSLTGGSGALEGLASIGGGLPVIGIVAGLSAFVSGLLKSGGGPKTGGFATTGPTPGITGTTAGRWMTPSDQDASLRTFLQGTNTTYENLAKTLKIQNVHPVFAMGMSMDPRGTAPSNVHSGVWVGGKQIYNMEQPNLPRDQASVDAAMQLEGKRMLIAALKASDLPGQLGKLFANIISESLSSDAADNLLAFSDAYTTLYDLMNSSPLDDALESIKNESRGAQGALEDQATALEDLVAQYDGTAASTTALASATQDYYNNVVALLAHIEKIKDSITRMFSSSIKEYTFAGLDTAGRYAYLQADAAQLEAELRTTTDADRVNVLAQMIDADMREAWGLLTPEQQAQASQQYIASAQKINELATQRLTEIGEKTTNKLNDILTTIKTVIDGAADKMGAAGVNLLTGSGQILEAAETLATSEIHVTLDQTSNVGGG